MSVSEAAAQASVPPDALDGLSLPERVALLRGIRPDAEVVTEYHRPDQ